MKKILLRLTRNFEKIFLHAAIKLCFFFFCNYKQGLSDHALISRLARIQIIPVVNTAPIVPLGIEREPSFKSPDLFDPAIMPKNRNRKLIAILYKRSQSTASVCKFSSKTALQSLHYITISCDVKA